jgi:molybdopterin-guanine dinucleotide biosynthesis protein B
MSVMPHIPIITIIGRSGSGKTTLIEKLLREFRRRGYRVGTVKHHLHDVDIDKEGKDSWRHARAGADTVLLVSPRKLAVLKDIYQGDLPLETLVSRYVYDVDLILAEGYKSGKYPKVEIFRQGVHDKPLWIDEDTLIATVTDCAALKTGSPCFGLEEIVPLVDLLEKRFCKRLGEKRKR